MLKKKAFRNYTKFSLCETSFMALVTLFLVNYLDYLLLCNYLWADRIPKPKESHGKRVAIGKSAVQ